MHKEQIKRKLAKIREYASSPESDANEVNMQRTKIRKPPQLQDFFTNYESNKYCSRTSNMTPQPFLTATTCLSHGVLSQQKTSVSRSRRTREYSTISKR